MKEHPADVRMPDNGNLRCIRILAFGQIFALEPFTGVINGIEIGTGPVQISLGADPQARFIHHVKHDLHPFVFFPEQKTPTLPLAPQGEAAGKLFLF